MRIYGFTEYGGPEVARFHDVEVPVPEADMVLVKVLTSGVNPADIKVRNGQRQANVPVRFPMAMGREAVGEVVEDPAVTLEPGSIVLGQAADGFGTLGEYALLNRAATTRLPDGVTPVQGACIPIAIGTAWDAIEELGLPEGATLLVLGAGGGVGSHGVQLARVAGLRVIGVASEAKKELVSRLGGEHVVSGDGWDVRVRELAGGQVDGVVDCVGGDVLKAAMELVADPAKVRSAAAAGEAERLGGSGITRRRSATVFGQLAEFIASGDLEPIVGATYSFDDVADAVARVEEGHAEGRTVVEF